MKLALSTIGLTPKHHEHELAMLPELGIVGVEVAPSRVWDSAWRDLRPTDVSAYRHQIENAGLSAIGLHSLFYDQPHLGLFKHGETRKETIDFMTLVAGL